VSAKKIRKNRGENILSDKYVTLKGKGVSPFPFTFASFMY